MDTSRFAAEIIGGLKDACYPQRRNTQQRKVIILCDNTPIHNTRTVMRQLEQSRFKRMGHPPYGPDLVLYHFFFWLHKETTGKKDLCRRRGVFISAF
jgi:transposase